MYVCTCVCIHVCMYICIDVYMYMYRHIYVYMYVRIYVPTAMSFPCPLSAVPSPTNINNKTQIKYRFAIYNSYNCNIAVSQSAFFISTNANIFLINICISE